MSNKKLKSTQNNENLCPIARKRTSSKASPQKTWKLAKLESTSSPSALTLEDLEEMGIGMLDSEESSSSATSTIALVMSGSADENSNDTTPNLDAAKFYHQQKIYPNIDISLDNSSDNANQSLLDTTLEALKSSSTAGMMQNNNFVIYNDEQHMKEKVYLPQHKKIAILGCGAGIVPSSGANSNSNSNSPTGARLTRSPLKVVPSNNQDSNSYNFQQHVNIIPHNNQSTHHQAQQQQPISQISVSSANSSLQQGNHHIHQQISNQQQNKTSTQQQKQREHMSQYHRRTYSPSSQPSTSHQAATLLKQQQQQMHQQKVQKYQNLMRNQMSHVQHYHDAKPESDSESFFLYRQANAQADNPNVDQKDHFSELSDEIILHIFKWLPKKALIRCGMVSRRFSQCASDESLWTRLDLGGRSLRSGAMDNILTRGVVVLRLAQSQCSHPVFSPEFLETQRSFETKLQYLDLSMSSISKPSLRMLLAHCRSLKKLSLEHVPVNDEICNEIAKNTNLETLNLGMCSGLEAWSIRKMMESLQNLTSLNISWTNLSVDAVTSLVTNITPNILRLNIAGCRKTMFDSHVSSLAKRCTQLLELDLSDCSGLTGNAITIICKFKMLEYLSLSRCYLIPAASYVELSNLSTLTYLDIFGMLSDTALDLFQSSFPNLGINKFIHSSVARPTVGTRRTSIWGLRTRD